MRARRDALAAAAKLALEIRNIAGKHPDAVCTIGSVKTFPGIVTAVVGPSGLVSVDDALAATDCPAVPELLRPARL